MTNRERADALNWLNTPQGETLLEKAAVLPSDRLTRLNRLRQTVSADIAAVAVELLELRARAKTKFTHAEQMLFTPEGLEQATGDRIAAHRASRFPDGAGLLDACCGIGGDAVSLAERGPVLAVDANPAAVVCARHNARLTGSANYSVYPLCINVTQLDLARLRRAGVRSAFFDPSRRVTDAHGARRRARASDDYLPPLVWLSELARHFESVGAKVSPAIDDDALHSFIRSHNARVEFVSDHGECKEAVCWLGPPTNSLPDMGRGNAGRDKSQPLQPDAAYIATVLRPNLPPAVLAPNESSFITHHSSLSTPQAWLYEPDPAVIRAHLVPTLAAQIDAAPMEPQIAYLTGDVYHETPFATAYAVRDALPYNPKTLTAWFRARSCRVEAVKKRGVPFAPEEVKRALAKAETPDGEPVVVVLTRIADKPFALLCSPPHANRQD